jgi:hypothetical protein
MSLVNTRLQAIRSQYAGSLDKYEDRLSNYGAWAKFVEDTNDVESIVTPDILEKAGMSAGNTLEIPVIDGEDVTISNVRTCTIADDESTSALVTVTFATYQFGFTMIPGQYANNEIGYMADFERKIKRYGKKFAETLDSAAVTKLEADKTAIMNSPFIGIGAKYGALAGDAVQVTTAQKQFFFNDLGVIMQGDDFEGRYNVIGSTTLQSTVNQYLNQGTQNGTNSMFQFGQFDFGYSNRVSVDTAGGKESTAYCMPKGSLATMNRNIPDAINGERISENDWFDIFRYPIVDLDMALRYSKECSDNETAVGGTQPQLKASVKETFIFSTDVAFVTAYNRDAVTLPGAIHKAEMDA